MAAPAQPAVILPSPYLPAQTCGTEQRAETCIDLSVRFALASKFDIAEIPGLKARIAGEWIPHDGYLYRSFRIRWVSNNLPPRIFKIYTPACRSATEKSKSSKSASMRMVLTRRPDWSYNCTAVL